MLIYLLKELKKISAAHFIGICLIAAFISLPAGADSYLLDVPEGHWATEAVYELVRRGVTQGYPDGTFRGKKEISRYEVAVFLSKLVRSFNRLQGRDEKLLSELKSELALLKYERDKAARETQLSGNIEARARLSTLNPRGGGADYRLKVNLVKNMDENTSLKIGLDTVDAGFNTDLSRALATRLLDVEAKFKISGWNYKVNLGPGVVVHTDDFFPSENYTIYIRPKSAVEASTRIAKMDLSASYVTRQVETSGKIGVHELTAKVKYKFGRLALDFRPRLLFKIDGPRDILTETGLNYMLNENYITYLLWGWGDFGAGQSGMYLKVIEKIIDPWHTGTTLVLRFDKIGSKYRRDDLDEYEFCYLNNFNRLILDGTADLGIKINQKLLDNLSLEWKSDYVTADDYSFGENHPETYFICQLGFLYGVSEAIEANAFYRSYNVPSGIAQFSDPVPSLSEVIGIGFNCRF